MPKIPYEWRQNDMEIVLSLLVKNVLPEKLEVDIQPRECHVSITLPTGSELVFVLDPLLHRVDPERSSHQVLPSMVNIHLAKSIPRQRWQYIDDGDQPEQNDPPPPPKLPIQIISDLHLELFFPRPGGIGVQPGYSVFDCIPSARTLALLGDIGIVTHGGLYEFLNRQLYKYRYILFVMGTHEGYQSTYDNARKELNDFSSRMRAQRLSDPTLGTFHFLDQTRFDITDDVTILGCTLWSAIPPESSDMVGQGLNDFRKVQHWTIENYSNAHRADLDWLTNECATIKAQEPHRRIVVLTHHAPTMHGTCAPKYANSLMTSAFATELTTHPVWAAPISLWAFGRTHFNSDQVQNGIRVVSNQRGYEGVEALSSGFVPDFVVSV